tara:strand:+ start:4998 stop:5210 length:213 start_codon:yes stop_codon:yes gene_type:complete
MRHEIPFRLARKLTGRYGFCSREATPTNLLKEPPGIASLMLERHALRLATVATGLTPSKLNSHASSVSRL